jgi:hypothetical protein
MKIMKLKKAIKKKDSKLWTTDDLTPRRSHLAYLSRQAVKEKHAVKTWVYDSTVFLQNERDKTPKKIICPKDIPCLDKIKLK